MLNMGEDAFLKMKIMREILQLFQNAVRIATRFQLRTGHAPRENHQVDEAVPMEVDHYRQKIKCNYCHKIEHLIADCRARNSYGQVSLAKSNKIRVDTEKALSVINA